MKTIKQLLFVTLMASASTPLFAQNTPNPDAMPEQNGPMRVLSEPPRQKTTTENGQQPPLSILDRLRVGGSFGLSFGSITNIEISPILALQVTPKLTTGAGIIYQYYKSNIPGFSYQDNIYGGRVFGMYTIFDAFNAHAEYETMNRKYLDINDGRYKPTWINSFLVGGTYSQPTGGRLIRAVNLSILYNLSYNNQLNPSTPLQNISPYGSPLVVRASFF